MKSVIIKKHGYFMTHAWVLGNWYLGEVLSPSSLHTKHFPTTRDAMFGQLPHRKADNTDLGGFKDFPQDRLFPSVVGLPRWLKMGLDTATLNITVKVP